MEKIKKNKFLIVFSSFIVVFALLLSIFIKNHNNMVVFAADSDNVYNFYQIANNSTPTWKSSFGGYSPTYSIMTNSSDFGSDSNALKFWNSNTSFNLTLTSVVQNNVTYVCNTNLTFAKGSSYSGTDISQLPLVKGTFNYINYTGSGATRYIIFVLPDSFYITLENENFADGVRFYSMDFSLSSYDGVKTFTIGDSMLETNTLVDLSINLISTTASMTPEQEEFYNLGFENGKTEGYNNGYTEGSAKGNEEGYNNGYTDGVNSVDTQEYYNNGFKNGKTEGYNKGYTDGVAGANDYSFTGLIGAVIDVPVNTFKNLFNFNLLGVNILNLITALFTLCVIVVIIKFALGGK